MGVYNFYKPQRDIIYLTTHTEQETEQAGEQFGRLLLHPLITGTDHSVNLTVGLCGISGIGKTPFGKGAMEIFPEFCSRFFDSINESSLHSNIRNGVPQRFSHENKVFSFLWKNCAYKPTRNEIALTNRANNLNWIEHPHIPHLDQADIVILFGTFGNDAFSEREGTLEDYYTHRDHNYGYNPAAVQITSRNPMAQKIGSEMNKMRILGRCPGPAGTPCNKRPRTITLICASQKQAVHEMFDRFCNALQPYQSFLTQNATLKTYHQ